MKRNGTHAKKGKRATEPDFVTRAERAFRRAAVNVQSENQKHGLPLIVWRAGKLAKVRA